MNAKSAIGQLRARRVEVGLSQERLARAADCSTSMVRLVEHGYRPSDDMLARLAAALGSNPAAFCSPTTEPRRTTGAPERRAMLALDSQHSEAPRHGQLCLVEPLARPRRLESRDAINAWVEERRRVLTALIEAERLGQRGIHGDRQAA